MSSELTYPDMKSRVFYYGILLVLFIIISCEKETPYQKAEKEIGRGQYTEAIYIIRHHFKRGGDRTPKLLILEARALLHLGKETDAENSFVQAWAMDSTLAGNVAEIYSEWAVKSFRKGDRQQGRRFLSKALNYRDELSLGRYDAIAGEIMLEGRKYERAIFYLNRYLEHYQDTTGTAQKMMELAQAYEGTGDTEESIAIYRELLNRYTKSRFKSTARWNLENLIYREARNCYDEEDILEAENMLTELVSTAKNILIRGRALFLLGEISMREGEREQAIRYYRKVVNLNLHSSGRIVEEAKERIEKLELSQ